MEKITVIKVGGKIVEDAQTLAQLLSAFSNVKGHKVLVHGGGRSATKMAASLGIETQMVGGRRVTDAQMLNVVTMVYKPVMVKAEVAGTDTDQLVDYGFVGDVDRCDGDMLAKLIEEGIVPVMAPLTHDGEGNLLNTNADTIAAETAKALAPFFEVTLVYCFEKAGVLRDENDDDSVIAHINQDDFKRYVQDGVITGGMIPKIENALNACKAGVSKVVITKADAIGQDGGTVIRLA